MSEPLAQINPVTPAYVSRKVFPAGTWALEEPENSRAVVGSGQHIAWADGESLLVVGDTGHGKSTLTQNIMRTSIGLLPDVLGLAVRPFKRTLYVAADRPAQIRASLKRMVNIENRQTWDDCVYVHHGAPDFSLNEEPHRLLTFVRELAKSLDQEPFDCLIIDSLKDVVSEIDDNEAGIQINKALQLVCQQGIQVAVNMHPRKLHLTKGQSPLPGLDDVNGNKNIIAGAGSVLFIDKPAESGYSPLWHLKSPADRLEGYELRIDRPTGNLLYKVGGL